MSKKIRVAINGFGRIGRLGFKRLIENPLIELVAINDLSNPELLVHLLKHDSVHGKFTRDLELSSKKLNVAGHSVSFYQETEPSSLPWEKLGVDVVLESTGRFLTRELAGKHLQAGAKKVVLSAPGKGDILTIVLGVNEHSILANENIISNASCTTNCLAPMAQVLDRHFGIEKAYISTVHAYTSDQLLHDGPHKDFRRARGAASSIIPTSTGAAVAVSKVLPGLEGKLDGIALRVPIPDGSLTDFTGILSQEVSAEQINAAFEQAAAGDLKGILEVSKEELVSIDIVGNPHSCIVDAGLTAANGNLVKVVAWYDNEYAYACRTAELIEKLF